MSKLEVDAIEPQSGTTLTLGANGDTITIPSGATLSSTDPLVFPAGSAASPAITTTGDTNTGIFFPAADTIAFTEGGTEAMRISSNGMVGIGISPEQTSGLAIELGGSAANNAINFLNSSNIQGWITSNAYYDGTNWLRKFGGGGTSTAYVTNFNGTHRWYTAAASTAGSIISWVERMKIEANGDFILAGSTAQKASGTTWSNPSDTRLKDNKQNYTKGLNELLQINVKTWEWNGKAGTTQGDVGIGLIADEIETILPNTIDTYLAKLNEDDTEETDIKRFDATEITWLLLNSVKEQQAIIEELKATSTLQQSKIDALETRITTLENA